LTRFTIEQAAAAVEIQQLINEWALELDFHHGKNIAALVTEDCDYAVGGGRRGRASIVEFYKGIGETMAGQAMRHLNSNLCVNFRSADEASIVFNLLFFTTAGTGSTQPDPAAVADVRMDCRREADGHWRIARMDSNQPFPRAAR
jgi:ketosteroid isomerase-like protein